MKYTVDEKVAHNRNQNTMFSSGYVVGVDLYRAYPTASAKEKAEIKKIFATASKSARQGEQWDKGIMCGIRDAANERKARKGK